MIQEMENGGNIGEKLQKLDDIAQLIPDFEININKDGNNTTLKLNKLEQNDIKDNLDEIIKQLKERKEEKPSITKDTKTPSTAPKKASCFSILGRILPSGLLPSGQKGGRE